MDIAAWLQDLGRERYVSAFRDNDIDAEVLSKLTAEDLISRSASGTTRRVAQQLAAEMFQHTERDDLNRIERPAGHLGQR